MTDHFDAVVIGSGFGGSVMAYRLAAERLSVCLLERGKAYPPNSFPRTPDAMRRSFWDPSEGLHGMYNVWSFRGSGALVASGLGGGSLIYANVLVRKDEKWFVTEVPGNPGPEPWPVTRADLDPHYDAVERMMNVQQYPLSHPPYDQTAKTLAMREAARRLNPAGTPGLEWLPLNLAVSFRSRPVTRPDADDPDNPPRVGEPIAEAGNYHDMTRYTCRLCGECDIGCNYGSKNTLDFNYLTHAARLGASIRTRSEVRHFEPLEGRAGYRVTYVEHNPAHEGTPTHTRDANVLPPRSITCDRLILAAGTFGSSYLLLRNRAAFPKLSPALGSRYSVNGDLLSFIVNATRTEGGHRVPRPLDPSFGPVITGAVRFGDTLDGNGPVGPGFYVEDGGNPALLGWLAELSGAAGYLRRLVRFVKLGLKYRLGLSGDTDLSAEVAELLGECVTSHTSLPVLTMGRDCPDGRLRLDGQGYLECDWKKGAGSRDYYRRVRHEVARIADALGAKYMDNPAFRFNFQQVLTAHPLGGCPMGQSEADGVVDAWGEVFNYPGLYIADGSILPGPVGPNPSLTIAALSDRFAGRIIEKRKETH